MSTGSTPRRRSSVSGQCDGERRDLIEAAELYPPDVVAWMKLSPAERLIESAKLWDLYRLYGGTFEPDPDPQSPFFDPEAPYPSPADGGASVRIVRRSGI